MNPKSTFRKRTLRHCSGESGFSLLEVLIVLMIIGLVATLVGPRLLSQFDRSKVTTAKVQVRSLMAAVETMKLDLGRFPTTEEGLTILTTPPAEGRENWFGPYLNEALPMDPWGKPYVYAQPADPSARPRIGSLGSDGREGGDGDNADLFAGQ